MGTFRTFKYPLYPTVRQARTLDELLKLQCEVYNAALQERREAYRAGIRIKRFDQFSQLKEIRETRPEVMRFGVTVARGTLTRVERAFCGFFRRVKAGHKPGYPRFRSPSRFDTVSYEDARTWKLKEVDHRLYLMGVGHLKIKLHRPIRGVAKTLHVRREGRKWYALDQCEVPASQPLAPTAKVAGFDLGVTNLLTASDETRYPNPRHFKRGRDRLAAAQRGLSRKKKGSGRRRDARERVAACHRKIRNQRKDALHKLSRALIDSYDILVFENLQIANMIRSAAGTMEAPGTNVAQKTGLNREIYSASWGLLLRMLAYKAEEAGRELILVDPKGTSQRCPACGHQQEENRATQTEFRCLECGHEADADVNAAINILRLGLSQRVVEREVETGAAQDRAGFFLTGPYLYFRA